MDSRRDVKKSIIANIKVEAPHQHSPSPERRKRVAEHDEGPKLVKRVKVEDATPNGATPRSLKDTTSHKSARSIAPVKSETRDVKPSPAANGRLASSNSVLRATSPKHTPHVNGHGKNSGQTMHKRAISNGEPVSKVVPRLLSPLHIADLSVDKSPNTMKENMSESRRSPPKKRPAEMSSLKPQPKKLREEREPSPNAKKRKVLPPLLSPTLPPIVMEELARWEKNNTDTPSKEANLRNSQALESSVVVKKPPQSTREETIHVDNKKEPTQYVVTMKYKKRHAKTIERLLNLPSGGKKKTESLKKDDRTPRESSRSVEPGTARKRPQTTADTSEALKQPKAPDTLRPSTPPKQSTTMSRIASNSSQIGTPGTTNLTPSTQPPAVKRREPVAPEKLEKAHRCRVRHEFFMELATKLKHERDAIMIRGPQPVPDRDLPAAMSSGIQALLAWMIAVKLQSDAFDFERLPRQIQPWRQILPFFNIYKTECHKNSQLTALLLRIQAIFMHYMGRTQWFLPTDNTSAQRIISLNKDEAEAWHLADVARKKLGIYEGSSDASDGGSVGKLIDRLGPWTTLEDAIPVALDVLRNSLSTDRPWKPNGELAKYSRAATNGANG
ncbi:hypothetical protein GGR58DRAFT_510962 [Xylaria digitata]|nr:hypothetical protein GGR58DRAFT_510962 [Xylaria digitata]